MRGFQKGVIILSQITELNKLKVFKKQTGFTLAEIIVCSALFLVFIIIAGGLFENILKCYKKGEEIIRPVQSLRNAFYIVNSSLKSANKIEEIVQINQSPEFFRKVSYLVRNSSNDVNRFVLEVKETSEGKALVMTKSDLNNKVIFTKTLVNNLAKSKIVRETNDIVLSVEMATIIDKKNPSDSLDDVKIELKSLLFMRPTSE